MRWLVVIAVVLMGLEVREAAASCGGCCDRKAELLGWSKDGRTIAVREGSDDGSSQTVIYRDGREVSRWGGTADDSCGTEARPAVPATLFATLGLEPVRAAWRDAFAQRFSIVRAARGVRWQGARCAGVEVRDAAGTVVATHPTLWDPDETDCVSGRVLGGYVHPSGRWLLVKTYVATCGYYTEQRYQLVKL